MFYALSVYHTEEIKYLDRNGNPIIKASASFAE